MLCLKSMDVISTCYSTAREQWRSEGAGPSRTAIRKGWQNGGDDGKKIEVITKKSGYLGASGISRLLGAAKLQSAQGADNARCAAARELLRTSTFPNYQLQASPALCF